jgi:hypothetical protein
MELLSGEALSKYLLEKYSRNPKGWNFTIAPAVKDNFFDALVSGPEENWQLKIDSIFKPSPIVLGAKVETPLRRSVPKGVFPSYGYRKLEPEVILKILREQTSDEPENSGNLDKIIGSLEPTAPTRGGSYAEGPFVFTNKKILDISDSQKKLDERLSSGIRNLLREKYIGYG